jgi:putative hydrolase of the HAD superfamily
MSRHILAVCFDFGDTLVDEGTEVKNDRMQTLRAEFIPGADQLIRELAAQGVPLALISDGPVGNVDQVLIAHGLWDLFGAVSISEALGVEKPHCRLFDHALETLQVSQADYSRTVMVGNNLARDVKGANDLGMISVWLDGSPRYPREPQSPSEIPQYTIRSPLELLPLLEQIEQERTNLELWEVL